MRPSTVLRYGQSFWLDYMRRRLLTSGELERLREEGIRGVTSNPSIFEKAFSGSGDYDEALRALEEQEDRSASALYETLAVQDIQGAADVLRPVYDESEGADGYVSLEVSPHLAHDTRGTVAEARRLWKRLDRPNVMIKVPATREGIPAIRELLSGGVNVNVTLMFGEDVYRRVADAWLDGLETYRAKGGDLRWIASVASIFVSRFDVMVDPILEDLARRKGREEREEILGLVGQVGIANAVQIYRDFREICAGERFQGLAREGARPQRILFASTSTKDPRFSDVRYVESLIGPGTVDTVPPATLDAFRDHGRARETLPADGDGSERTLEAIERLGISLEEITARLLDEGVEKFSRAFDDLMATVEKRRDGALGPLQDRITVAAGPIEDDVHRTLDAWQGDDVLRRLWARDATLWTGSDEGRWLDWLDIVDTELSDLDRLAAFGEEVGQRGFTQVAVLGMGGSSLFPWVLSESFAPPPDGRTLHVLDSTDPAQIRTFEAELDLEHTLFVVSSKSGSTLEPNLFEAHFFETLAERLGAEAAAMRFVAVTDPGSPLEEKAGERGYWRVFHGVPGIGGRYSALSDFGLVPAAAMGLDVRGLLANAQRMVHACAACVPARQNPGALLGAVLGVAARAGRDKVTLVASPALRPLGAWIEQLLAESTGKGGKGLIPVDGEPLAAPEAYGHDRVFAYLRHDQAADPGQDAALDALADAGHPVVRLDVADVADLPQELFRWEVATAMAGSILELNPFDQPDVEASKEQARRLTDEYERSGRMAPEAYFFRQDPVGLFADDRNRAAIQDGLAGQASLGGYLRAHLARHTEGDYVALVAWVERSEANDRLIQRIRLLLRDRLTLATCVGYGPRFLHSTGQAYKGGPNSGLFLHIVGGDPVDVEVPGRRASFGVVKRAQARGDFRVLADRGRRLLGIDVGEDAERGLEALLAALRETG